MANFSDSKTILHVDMDAFFVSVEEALNPKLRGKPVVVGGDPNGRGVVSAASYKAREYGIHSAMPMAEAKRLCPGAIILRGSGHTYADFSSRVMDILREYTPDVEVVSVDEAYLDVSGCQRLHRADPVTLAHRIHNTIQTKVGIPASIGIGSNKLIAKIAANAAKPNGMVSIRPGYEASFLAPLPISRMPGIGPVTEKSCKRMGIRFIGDLLKFDPEMLEKTFGVHGGAMARKARGEDGRDVMSGSESGPDADRKSVSREVTYSTDTEDPERLKATLSYLSESVGRRVRKAGLAFRGVTLKLRYSDFSTYTRSRAFPFPSDDTTVILQTAYELLDQLFTRRARVRLIGVGVTTAHPALQLDLFEKKDSLKSAVIHKRMDEARERFGFEAVLLARSQLYRRGRSKLASGVIAS